MEIHRKLLKLGPCKNRTLKGSLTLLFIRGNGQYKKSETYDNSQESEGPPVIKALPEGRKVKMLP